MESNRGVQGRLSNKITPTLINAKSVSELPNDTNVSCINTLAAKNFEKYQVIVENELLEGELKCIEWRCKTEFPVVKVLFYKMLQKKLLNECSVLQVAIENFPANLHTLPQLALPPLLCLLKEALVGFERLFDRFGSFDPTQRMVLVNRNGKCRVWVNENITLNFPARRIKLTQSQFLIKILSLFEQKCLRSALSNDFFLRVTSAEHFIDCITILESFIKNNKIVLPIKLALNGEYGSSKKNGEKCDLTVEKNDDFFGEGSIKKIPKFIQQLREDRKAEEATECKSFDSPKKADPRRDRSFAKTVIPQNKCLPNKGEKDSQDKSNVSPLSQISQDNKQTKSNNQKLPNSSNKIPIKPAVRQLLKMNSQQVINTYATMLPISPNNKTDKLIPRPSQKEYPDLTLTKLPEKSQKRPRKMSNEQSPSKKQHPIMTKLNRMVSLTNEHCSVLCSQQTAATINQQPHFHHHPSHKLAPFVEQPPNFSILPKTDECEGNIYQKNGWLKRMNTLTSDNLRDTMQSHYDGQQAFSQDYLLVGETLGALGSMGRQLKASMVSHDFKL